MNKNLFTFTDFLQTDLGLLRITASQLGIKTIERCGDRKEGKTNSNDFIALAKKELTEYFDKKRKLFTVELDLEGYTVFQKQVWSELRKSEYGKTLSYTELAIMCGDRKKLRAVGRANGANPIPIIIPCHRIIGANGSLVGYSQGLDMKQFLLELENAPIQLNLF